MLEHLPVECKADVFGWLKQAERDVASLAGREVYSFVKQHVDRTLYGVYKLQFAAKGVRVRWRTC